MRILCFVLLLFMFYLVTVEPSQDGCKVLLMPLAVQMTMNMFHHDSRSIVVGRHKDLQLMKAGDGSTNTVQKCPLWMRPVLNAVQLPAARVHIVIYKVLLEDRKLVPVDKRKVQVKEKL